jgi:SPP1 family phage portal protein
MKKLYIDKEQELTTSILSKLIRYFNDRIKPDILMYKGYYDGVGQKIMQKPHEDPSKPCNKIVKNYCLTTTENFCGYITGTPITYAATNDEQDISLLLDCLNNNDVANSDSEWLRNALICGVAYQLIYINEKGEKKFRNLESANSFPVYSSDLDEELLYFVTYTPIIDWTKDDWNTRFSVSVYDNENIYHYECDSSFNSFVVCEPEQHYLSEVPIAVFELNSNCRSIFEPIISLQDAYNSLLSAEIDDFEGFVDAYLILTNVLASEEELAEMKRTKTLLLDGDSKAEYLTKSISDTQIQNMLENLNSSIHTVSNSPDFSSEEFNSGVSSGIALQFKLVGFNNIASNIEAQFRKALQKRIHLLNNVFGLLDTQQYVVCVTFNHNLPVVLSDTVTLVNSLRGLVSDRTLLAQLPFVQDVDAEIEATKAADIYEGAF